MYDGQGLFGATGPDLKLKERKEGFHNAQKKELTLPFCRRGVSLQELWETFKKHLSRRNFVLRGVSAKGGKSYED